MSVPVLYHLTAGNSHQHEKPIEEKELERAKRSGSREQPDSLMLEPIKMEIIIIDMDQEKMLDASLPLLRF